MSLSTWHAYLATIFFVCAIPGPNMMHVMTRCAHLGFLRSLPAMAGCLVALELLLSASALGIGVILTAYPWLFKTVCYAGAAYLVYIGMASLLRRSTGEHATDTPVVQGASPALLFRGGLLVGLSNPKALLFTGALIPQFINNDAPKLPQLALIVVTCAAAEVFWYVVYGLGGHGLRRWLARPGCRRLFDRAVGSVFVGFGVALLRARA